MLVWTVARGQATRGTFVLQADVRRSRVRRSHGVSDREAEGANGLVLAGSVRSEGTAAHWDVLAAAGVDLFNVDDLAAFETYAAEWPTPKRADR
jgi:2-polyprenyl-6-methoxyphenol hydroxylase-like FAD-dependent oxidoreductase